MQALCGEKKICVVAALGAQYTLGVCSAHQRKAENRDNNMNAWNAG